MATLRVYIEATGTTTALLTATFTGGDSSYQHSRALKISGIYGYTFYAESEEASGGSGTWSMKLIDLDPDTTYQWTAVLCSWSSSGWTETSYSKSGSFTTDGGGGSGCVYIYDGSWSPYTPYIYNGSQWVAYDPYVYDGSWSPSG